MFYCVEIDNQCAYGDDTESYHYYATLADALNAHTPGTYEYDDESGDWECTIVYEPVQCDVIEPHPLYGDDYTFIHMDGVLHGCDAPPIADLASLII